MPRKKSASQRKYSKAAGQEVHKEMHKFKQGTAHSGKGHAPIKSREQAIAIGLSKARKKGEKAPKAASKKGASSSSGHASTSGRKSHNKKASTAKKSTVTQRSSSRNSHVRRARYSGY